MKTPDRLGLTNRQGLPDALQVLLHEYPRDLWQEHRNFDGLIRFWLERHLMFRRILEQLRDQGEGFIAGRIDPLRHGRNTAQLAGTLIHELHGHHQIEDQHYFPRLARMEPRLKQGFTLLDGDHHALDGHLEGLTESANALLKLLEPRNAAGAGKGKWNDAASRLQDDYTRFERFLDRHLTDEEDLVVPVLLRHGARL
jgi:iron-sulfur cluster repair protein YtfE (RIC family)